MRPWNWEREQGIVPGTGWREEGEGKKMLLNLISKNNYENNITKNNFNDSTLDISKFKH